MKRKLRILAVDDNPMNLFVIELLLGELIEFDIEVKTAMNGELALEVIRKQERDDHFTHVFLDLHMPVMDGYQASRALREMINEGNIHL